MMTREEAITLFEKQLTAAKVVLDGGFGSNPGENDFLYRRRKDMAEIPLSALRPVSREQVEKVWSGCEKCHNQDNWPSWIEKGFVYCPKCGTPLTSWAWEKQMKRLEALKDGSTTD